MPCYDGCREDERIDREAAKKVEAALCAVITAFGGRRVFHEIDFEGCGVTMEWLDRWWEEHQRKDAERKDAEAARKVAVRDYGRWKCIGAMINKREDIEATVAAIQAAVPGNCETFAPENPTASGVLTTYFGNVRVVEAFDPVLGLTIRRADLWYREKQK